MTQITLRELIKQKLVSQQELNGIS
jgi:hypothetical protein